MNVGIGMINRLLNHMHKAKTAPIDNEIPQAYAAPTTPIASNQTDRLLKQLAEKH